MLNPGTTNFRTISALSLVFALSFRTPWSQDSQLLVTTMTAQTYTSHVASVLDVEYPPSENSVQHHQRLHLQQRDSVKRVRLGYPIEDLSFL